LFPPVVLDLSDKSDGNEDNVGDDVDCQDSEEDPANFVAPDWINGVLREGK